jgi:hypothetical protein
MSSLNNETLTLFYLPWYFGSWFLAKSKLKLNYLDFLNISSGTYIVSFKPIQRGQGKVLL